MNFRKSAVAAALSTTLGVMSGAEAAIIQSDWSGLFTFLASEGYPLANTSYPYYADPTWGYGFRTQISGSLVFDTDSGAGSATVNPFEFLNASAPGFIHDFVVQAVGDGFGGPGTLLAGSFLFDWADHIDINVGIVFDAAGFFGAMPLTIGDVSAGDVIAGVGALPATDGMSNGKYPIGPSPIATTAYDTNFHNDPSCVAALSCVVADPFNIGGDPMDNGPFPDFNLNIDISSMTITAVPIPAAVWLLGSGLLGLQGVARRRTRH